MAWSSDDWKIFVSIGEIFKCNISKIHGGMPSGPGALSHFRPCNCFLIPLPLTRMGLFSLVQLDGGRTG